MANVVLTAAAIGSSAFTSAKFDTGAINAAAIAAAACNKVADHVLRRSFANAKVSSDGDTKGFRSLLGAVAKLVNKVAIAGTTLSIHEDNDTTVLGTQTVTSAAGANPITGVDTD